MSRSDEVQRAINRALTDEVLRSKRQGYQIRLDTLPKNADDEHRRALARLVELCDEELDRRRKESGLD